MFARGEIRCGAAGAGRRPCGSTTIPPVLLQLLHRAPPGSPPATRGLARDQEARAGGRVLRCLACGAAIADADDRVALQGGHEHVFVNPGGHDYRIRLYHQAPGACPIGPATSFYSWFPGYAWRVLVCGGCGAHLGWDYGPAPGFVGLIVDRLAEDPA